MGGRVHNIFVSHTGKDASAIEELKTLLTKAGRSVRDSSITKETKPNEATNEQYIKSEIIAPAIRWAGTLIVLISPDTKASDFVDWEIEYASQHEKRIVGVWLRGSNDCDIPDKLDEFADAVVGWNTDKILAAIDGDLNNWECADGSAKPDRPIRVYNC